jgi:predicted nucleic acid-binding protein
VYFDTSYIAKFYLNEPDSELIRVLVNKTGVVRSSMWAFAEVHSVLHRHIRERRCSSIEAARIASQISEHMETGLWDLAPVSESLLRRTAAFISSAPRNLFLRTADAIHLTTAQDAGELEVWTNDRQMLAAAPYFGLTGRSV